MVSKKFLAAILFGFAAFLPFSLSTQVSGASNVPAHTGSARRESVPEHTGSARREIVAHEFVDNALRTWQRRLNLNEWKITVDLVRASSLEPRTLGNIHWDSNLKQASISVLSAYDYTLATPDMLDDMEFTVVHELIHLHLASLPHSDASRRPEENAVNELAHAFIRLAPKANLSARE
jgi:hypothetical protein